MGLSLAGFGVSSSGSSGVPNLLAPGTGFMEGHFAMDQEAEGMVSG